MTGRRDEAWWLLMQLRKLRWYICIECDADGRWHVQLGKDCRGEGTDLAEAVLQACHMALNQQAEVERDLYRLVERWRREDARRSANPAGEDIEALEMASHEAQAQRILGGGE